MQHPTPLDESERLQLIRQMDMDNEDFKVAISPIMETIRLYFNVPIVILTLIDENTQYFLSKIGMNFNKIPREISFCIYALMQDGIFIVEDATKEQKFKNNPLVISDPFVKYYAGVPIKLPSQNKEIKINLATIAILSNEIIHLKKGMQNILRNFSKIISNYLMINFFPTEDVSAQLYSGWISICSWCKDLREKDSLLDDLLSTFNEFFEITHGMCDDCLNEQINEL